MVEKRDESRKTELVHVVDSGKLRGTSHHNKRQNHQYIASALIVVHCARRNNRTAKKESATNEQAAYLFDEEEQNRASPGHRPIDFALLIQVGLRDVRQQRSRGYLECNDHAVISCNNHVILSCTQTSSSYEKGNNK